MKPSLSVILPVHNAEKSLVRVVARLLETLPELTAQFEILVVDDGSADHTAEIADDLRRVFPQVRVARHGWSWGTAAAVRTGRLQCRGQFVIVADSQHELNPPELARQWACLTSFPPAQGVSALDTDAAEAPLPQQPWVRTESAHADSRRQREPSFLRHLRQLSSGV